MEPLFRGTLGPTALARLGHLQQARQRVEAEIAEVIATVAEAQGHRVVAGEMRLLFDLTTKEYAGVPERPPPPTLVVPPAQDQDRSA